MSTTPSTIAAEILETTGAAISAIEGTTGVTETASGLESIKEIMDAFDPAALLPDISGLSQQITSIARFAVMAGPLVLLAMGLAYLFLSPKEANYRFGYRCYHGMGSVEAWRFTQRLAGLVWGGLGLALSCVMFFVTGGFPEGEVVAVIDSAIGCIGWEIGLTLVSVIAINTLVLLRYDRFGNRRK